MIKQKEGFSYSLEPFEGYTHRYKVEVHKSSYFNGPYSTDIYTDNPDNKSVAQVLRSSEFVNQNPGCMLTIVHTATKEQDEATAAFIEETLKDW